MSEGEQGKSEEPGPNVVGTATGLTEKPSEDATRASSNAAAAEGVKKESSEEAKEDEKLDFEDEVYEETDFAEQGDPSMYAIILYISMVGRAAF